MPPAATVDDLLVGQHGGAQRAPVHLALLAKSQSLLQHAQEEPLRPAVVVGQAGGDLGLPVIAQSETAHLAPHVSNVFERPLARRRVVFEGCIFRRQAKGIPAHGVEHVIALHPHVTSQGVANSIVAHVAHVQLARGIGQHLKHVILGPLAALRLGAIKIRLLIPELLPAHFDFRRVVAHLVRRRGRGGDGGRLGAGAGIILCVGRGHLH